MNLQPDINIEIQFQRIEAQIKTKNFVNASCKKIKWKLILQSEVTICFFHKNFKTQTTTSQT